jgi:hypothetical protein
MSQVPSLHEDLRESSASFAQSALRAFLDEDGSVFLLHAATALEQLAKSFLASVHASLIAGNDFDSLLHACEQSSHARKPRSRMKTITAHDALERSGQLLPQLDNLKKSLQILILVRNGVVHAGMIEPKAEEAVLVPFLRACDHLLAAMPSADREKFWGDTIDIVDARLSKSADAAEIRAADAIASARHKFEARYGSMSPSLRSGLIANIESSYTPEKYLQTLASCPACDCRALVHGSYDVDWQPDWDYADGEDYVAGAYPVVQFSPGGLECRACDLELEGEDELAAAGVPSTWTLPEDEVNPRDFYEDEGDY